MPEWLKGTGCKPVGYAYVGSNPTPSTTLKALSNSLLRAPCASEPPIGVESVAKSTQQFIASCACKWFAPIGVEKGKAGVAQW